MTIPSTISTILNFLLGSKGTILYYCWAVAGAGMFSTVEAVMTSYMAGSRRMRTDGMQDDDNLYGDDGNGYNRRWI